MRHNLIAETDEAKVKPSGHSQSWDSRSKLDGKWFAEGKGKGRHGEHEAEPTEYLDREPALRAEHVLACS